MHKNLKIKLITAHSRSPYQIKETKTRYSFINYYLNYLYKNHVNLKLEIMIGLFDNNETNNQSFIDGKADLDEAEKLCRKVTIFLKNHDYSVGCMEHTV